MMSKLVKALCVGLLLLGLAVARTPVSSQPAGTPAPPKTGEPKKLAPRDETKKRDKKDQVRIKHADRARYDSARKLFYLYGHVVFEDKDMQLFCDEASYNEADDTAACAGGLKIVDKENVITGQLVNADFSAEIINIEGNVKIVTTKTLKSQETEGEEKRETTITCDKIVYTYTEGKRFALASGNLKAVQKDKTVVADKAEYDREKDIIVLSPKVVITMENGNNFNCDKATISVTEDWVEMEPMTGMFFRDTVDKEAKPTAGTP